MNPEKPVRYKATLTDGLTRTWVWVAAEPVECMLCQDRVLRFTRGKIPGGGARTYPLCRSCRPWHIDPPERLHVDSLAAR